MSVEKRKNRIVGKSGREKGEGGYKNGIFQKMKDAISLFIRRY